MPGAIGCISGFGDTATTVLTVNSSDYSVGWRCATFWYVYRKVASHGFAPPGLPVHTYSNGTNGHFNLAGRRALYPGSGKASRDVRAVGMTQMATSASVECTCFQQQPGDTSNGVMWPASDMCMTTCSDSASPLTCGDYSAPSPSSEYTHPTAVYNFTDLAMSSLCESFCRKR